MLRVIEHAQRTDTGRQRPANEDSFLARAPLFAVADGMGGAQAGEVASRMAVEVLHEGLGEGTDGTVAERLRGQVAEANRRIHDRAQSDSRSAGMGTTLTAAYVDERQLVVVHVGDSRLYRLRQSHLERLTRDHSLVEELVRQGRLTPEEAAEHPQRSIITRALGPEAEVAIDSEVLRVENHDLYMVCSDGLTAMLSEDAIADLLNVDAALQDRVDALVDAANAAGGRDNITVLLFRVVGDDEPPIYSTSVADVDEEPTQPLPGPAGDGPGGDGEQPTAVLPAVPAPERSGERSAEDDRHDALNGLAVPREPRRVGKDGKKRRRGPSAGPFIVLFLVGCVMAGIFFASQTVYFVGSYRGLVTVYRGLPYELPLGIDLYSPNYPSSVPVDELSPEQREQLLDHRLRSLGDANDLVSRLERGEVAGP